MAKKVTVIKAAKAQKHTQEERRLKVCGYARVSTGSQAQATSYTAQVEYYTEKIESNPLWEFAGVYADEGISGTNVKHRDEFQMMISAKYPDQKGFTAEEYEAVADDYLAKKKMRIEKAGQSALR